MAKIEYSMITKPIPGEFVSGDLAWAKEFNQKLLLCLIDISGHGDQAYKLAQKCIHLLEDNYQEDLTKIIFTFDKFMKGTRGMVIGLSLIEISTGLVNYLGIGNIRARILGQQSYRFVSRTGVLGFTKTRPILEKYLLNNNDIFLMYSDGIRDRFEKNNILGITQTPINLLPDRIISLYSKQTDDASCIAARYYYD